MGTVTQYNLANVRDALGGGNPVYMSNYYRGGPYVPANRTVATTVYEPDGGGWTYSGNTYWYSQPALTLSKGSQSAKTNVFWGGTLVYTNGSYNSVSSVTIGGITYFQGPAASVVSNGTYYNIRRQYPSSYQQAINTGVPSGGAIYISQLYGAENP